MGAFSQGFNFGFLNGAFSRMPFWNPCCSFNNFMPFNFSCYCASTPLFLTPRLNFNNFIHYPQVNTNFNMSYIGSNYTVPNFLENLPSNIGPVYSAPSFLDNLPKTTSNRTLSVFTAQKTNPVSSEPLGDHFVKTNKNEAKQAQSSNFKANSVTNNKNISTSKISNLDNNTYNSLILKYAKIYDVDPNLIKAMMKQESRFNPTAESSAGAKGLMQLMPDTANSLGVKVDLENGIDNRNNPELNIMGGVKYISQQLKTFNGDVRLALAAYNAGPGNVKNGRIPQNGETPKYVSEVMKNYNKYKQT